MTNTLNTWQAEFNLHIPHADKKANRAIDVSAHIKKNQGLDYLAWSVSQDLLAEYNDALDVGFEEDDNGNPFFCCGERGVYLKPYLFDRTSGKRTPSTVFPVRDTRRKSSSDVSMDTIGNQMQRAYSKTIAKETGLGWSLYSKYDESIPTDEPAGEIKTFTRTQPKATPQKVVPAYADLDF